MSYTFSIRPATSRGVPRGEASGANHSCLMSKKIIASSARSLAPIKPYISDGQQYRLMIRLEEVPPDILRLLSLPASTEDYEFLPPDVGRASRVNLRGEEKVLHDAPMETVHRMVDSRWLDWHGKEHTGIVARAYKRRPRFTISPPGTPFILTTFCESRAVVTEVCTFTEAESPRNLRILNLFLEVFREAEIIDTDGSLLLAPKLKKLAWDVLPEGDYPWEKAKEHVQRVTSSLPPSEQAVIDFRMKEIARYSPKLLAVGTHGFHGYFVFGFPQKSLFVLESIHLDNATYLFETDWTKFADLSKKEIIEGGLHKERIIHDKKWAARIKLALR